MQEGYINCVEKLHYLKWGNGRRILLAFHGYGEDAHKFQYMANELAADFTTIAVDLPFHGRSEWSEGTPFTKEDLLKLIQSIIEEYQTNQITLVGYSIGGRVCLKLMEMVPEKIEQVLLIAPDGLVLHPLYVFATRTTVGKFLFRKFLTGGRKYNRLIDGLYQSNFVDPARYKFAMRFLNDPNQRQLLLRVWPNMRLLLPNKKKVRENIIRRGIWTDIFMGRYDHIITLRQGKAFVKGMPEFVRLHQLAKGHSMWDQDSIQKMVASLLWKQ